MKVKTARRWRMILLGLSLVSGAAKAAETVTTASVKSRQTKAPVVARSAYLGHNLAVSTETSKAKTVTAGTYLVGYSPTDRFTVGTSPWMIFGYNTYNVVVRYNFIRNDNDELSLDGDSDGAFDAVSLQAAYLKSGEFAGDFYRQEIAIAWLTGKVTVNPSYDFYLTGNYMYFFDETIPFSLRREPFNDEKYQLSIATLHTLKLTDIVRVSLEFGVLGLRARYPQVHSGASLAILKKSYLVQIGFSVTATPYNFERFFESSTSARPDGNYYDASVHPEVQLQYFF